jgi:hypothetical protein
MPGRLHRYLAQQVAPLLRRFLLQQDERCGLPGPPETGHRLTRVPACVFKKRKFGIEARVAGKHLERYTGVLRGSRLGSEPLW